VSFIIELVSFRPRKRELRGQAQKDLGVPEKGGQREALLF